MNTKNDIIDVMMLIRSIEGYSDLMEMSIKDSFLNKGDDSFYQSNYEYYKDKRFDCRVKLDTILRKYGIVELPDPSLDLMPRYPEV